MTSCETRRSSKNACSTDFVSFYQVNIVSLFTWQFTYTVFRLHCEIRHYQSNLLVIKIHRRWNIVQVSLLKCNNGRKTYDLLPSLQDKEKKNCHPISHQTFRKTNKITFNFSRISKVEKKSCIKCDKTIGYRKDYLRTIPV